MPSGCKTRVSIIFIEHDLPFLRQYDTRIFVNIIGRSVEEYVGVTQRLEEAEGSTPSRSTFPARTSKKAAFIRQRSAFGSRGRGRCEAVTSRPVITEAVAQRRPTSRNGPSIEVPGADAISLVNTFLGHGDRHPQRRPVLANTFGGLSGPAIKPIALRMVWQVYEAVSVPIIGMGGIMQWQDAAEFVLAGAKAVAVGTANFTQPYAAPEVVRGLQAYVEETGIPYEQLVGAAHSRARGVERC